MNFKKILSAAMAIATLASLSVLPASAQSVDDETTEVTAVIEVDESEANESEDVNFMDPEYREVSEEDQYFPEGIPDFLTEDQVQTVLDGQYLKVEDADQVYHFNYDNKPMANTRATWTGMNFSKGATWYPEYATLTYKVSGNKKTGETKYFIGNQDQSTGNSKLKGRAWAQVIAGGSVAQNQSEAMHKPLIGSYYVETSTAITTSNAASKLNYAYRNLVTNWSNSIEVKL